MAVLAMLGAGFWWYAGREVMLPSIVEDVEVDLSLQGVRLSQGEDGRQSWTLLADSAKFDEESGLLHLTEPRVTYEDEDGPVFVQAPEGEVSQERNTARMWPRVQAEYREYTVTAERLEYAGKKDLISFFGKVVMVGENGVIRAPEAAIDLDENVMTARGGVEAVLNDSGGFTPGGEAVDNQEKGKEE